METSISENKQALGAAAAARGAEFINRAIEEKGAANIILATGASQFEMLEALLKIPVDWTKVTAFHLDEYIGLRATHPASFRKYLKERFADKVQLKAFHYVDGEAEPEAECRRLEQLIQAHPIDVAFIGIGENAHLAFNDPPADFETDAAYIPVTLDEACRRQQFGEGWFSSLETVPRRAISMSIRQIMQSKTIICSVPDARKADAVKNALRAEISPEVPASILREHPDTWLYLDRESAGKL
ncbi:glucosamine-6-phosphate deaminase [Flavilitoribacter nigricans]|uniref:Glucosamine-6-phosphate deaminase n=1 Tax=Flavilitoribacter nigricans (strain ATCC 23147 / DSM 23189 / NBRC 102662 / NCIMB 1420 / SS-2) TaxID=1122177 RepID=A0A2D0NHD8_FLAN2|nr:glucosamine-6-phosphate deaminase [Flavilitoribacter nigricans]PHN07838.1 glucosamine-6-phosphate deaminase [Flavilitoribacter nigricans DSM 23189 = NBRC 102662]